MKRALILFLAVFAIVAFAGYWARSHQSCNPDNGRCQVYDAVCCSERDCKPVPVSAVEITRYGFRVHYGGRFYDIKNGAYMISTDGRYHLCVYEDPYEGRSAYVPESTPGVMCFYAPGGGV